MTSERVLVLFNEPVLPLDHPDSESERDVLNTVEAVQHTLSDAGFHVSRLGVSNDPEVLLSDMRLHKPDVVFNLFEGTGDRGGTESYVAGLLEWLRIPFTGSPHATLCLARSKHLCKTLFQGAGVPTPAFLVVDRLPVPRSSLGWPVMVKPAQQDASVGIDHGSVVTAPAKLEERIAYLLKNYGPPVLVEQFIRGRELNLALVEAPELQVLPISEILFADRGPGFWPIVTYESKWSPGSAEDKATPPVCPADMQPELAHRLEEIARQAFRLLGCRDYVRFDFRVDAKGEPYLLEVNPNPDFGPSAGLARALTAAGMTHAQFTVALVRNALSR